MQALARYTAIRYIPVFVLIKYFFVKYKFWLSKKKVKRSTSLISKAQVKMLINGFQELGIIGKGKSIQYNYLNPTAIGDRIYLSLHWICSFVFDARDLDLGTKLITICMSPWRPGHSLGMDIHDSTTLSKDTPLEPGVVSRSADVLFCHFTYNWLSFASITAYMKTIWQEILHLHVHR